jgi:hypothetical protein
MFVNQQTDPLNFMGASMDAATAQLGHDDPSFGQGAKGYSKRYSAGLADRATGDFFGVFLYPSIFHQDPRYYRQGQGSVKSRLGHALSHRLVTHSDSGRRMFNFSEWATIISSKAISNLYHPDNPRGFAPNAERVGWNVTNDMAWDVLREFWPEIAHKLKLPFRTRDAEWVSRSRPTPAPVAAPAAAPFRTLTSSSVGESLQ